jgi:hypothetical protein
MYHVKENEMQEIRGILAACQYTINQAIEGIADKKGMDDFSIVLLNTRDKINSIPFGERG